MASTVQVHGLKELGARLRALPKEIAGKNGGPLLSALRKMGGEIQKAAQQRVPVDTGTLRENIIVTRDRAPQKVGMTEVVHVTVRFKAKAYRDNKKNRRKARVGAEYKDHGRLFYAKFLEFGTINAPPHPFMRPAFEETKPRMPEMFRTELSAAIARAVRKLNRGGR
ncbi:HK97-gp10 family putative phage morphogenesis protein [Dokdonella sp. MW10]|uniref:HK97-gp10 family putative phage morphogenesis protein n=1 Tax=Dokdonella sp. MW10 TaxID=2992926 RepID=UPI003F7E05A5